LMATMLFASTQMEGPTRARAAFDVHSIMN
jgi:hypothetical protein